MAARMASSMECEPKFFVQILIGSRLGEKTDYEYRGIDCVVEADCVAASVRQRVKVVISLSWIFFFTSVEVGTNIENVEPLLSIDSTSIWP